MHRNILGKRAVNTLTLLLAMLLTACVAPAAPASQPATGGEQTAAESSEAAAGGETTLRLLDRLDAVVKEAHGRLYPAKDGRIPATMFRDGYRELGRFAEIVDPAFSSSFWRKVTSQHG